MTTSQLEKSPAAARSRAVSVEDKALRRTAILDAAERLLETSPDRSTLMSELAERAGIAKGTLYLYFPSKESLILAVHERHCEVFFETLIARLEQSTPATFDDIAEIAQIHMINHPTYLSCASACFLGMERNLPLDEIQAHMLRIAQWIERSALGLSRHFHPIDSVQAASLLHHSYALIIGLWQLLKPEAQARIHPHHASGQTLRREFAREVDAALRALWTGTFAALPAASNPLLKR
jgi:AcrR family transcriptional regulator